MVLYSFVILVITETVYHLYYNYFGLMFFVTTPKRLASAMYHSNVLNMESYDAMVNLKNLTTIEKTEVLLHLLRQDITPNKTQLFIRALWNNEIERIKSFASYNAWLG